MGSNSSGCSHIGGSDVAVALGGFTSTVVNNVIHNRGTIDQQSGTLMHELGHNLGFRHGGKDNVNCKPNYLSVMSYSRQFSNLIPGRRLDYSRFPTAANEVITLNEPALGLNESVGIGPGPFPANEKTVFGGSTDWPTSCPFLVGSIGTSPGGSGARPRLDINNLSPVGCTADGLSSLVPDNDWENAQYNLRASLEFAGGADTETTDVTAEQEEAGFAAVDNDGNQIPDGFQCGTPAGGPAAACLLDIKPGDPLNPANLASPTGGQLNGALPVALLSTATFNAPQQVNPVTLTLDGFVVDKCNPSDVNGDGRPDLKCNFRGVRVPSAGSYLMILTGKLFTGEAIRARDVVNVH